MKKILFLLCVVLLSCGSSEKEKPKAPAIIIPMHKDSSTILHETSSSVEELQDDLEEAIRKIESALLWNDFTSIEDVKSDLVLIHSSLDDIKANISDAIDELPITEDLSDYDGYYDRDPDELYNIP